jgi:hypothetical protein
MLIAEIHPPIRDRWSSFGLIEYKKWEGKRKRAENKLKKLQKREKVYMKQLQSAKIPPPQ